MLNPVPAKNVIEARFQLNVVFVNVVIEVFCPQDLGYSHQLQKNMQQLLRNPFAQTKISTQLILYKLVQKHND